MAHLPTLRLAAALAAAAALQAAAATTGSNKETDERAALHAIVQYVAVRTYLPEQLCRTASPGVRAEVDEIVERFRARFPELVRLAEASPLFAEANQPNVRTVSEYAGRSPQEHDDACLQLGQEIAVDLRGDQAYFDKWIRALRRQAN